jgi:hypothetical protein
MTYEKEPQKDLGNWEVERDDRKWLDVIHHKKDGEVFGTPLRCDPFIPDYSIILSKVVLDPDDQRVILEPFTKTTYRYKDMGFKTTKGIITDLSVVLRDEEDVINIGIKFQHEKEERTYEFRYDQPAIIENAIGEESWVPGLEPELALLDKYFNKLAIQLNYKARISLRRTINELITRAA